MADPFDTTALPVTEPLSIVASSYAGWRKLLEYDALIFDIVYTMTPVTGGSVYTITGTKSGDYWIFQALSSVTATWSAGDYRWDMKVVRKSDSETFILSTGHVTVFATSDDRRTHAEIMVDKIESVLNNRADHDIESYSIASRSLTKMSVKELMQWREYYLAEISRTGGSVTNDKMPRKNLLRVRWI